MADIGQYCATIAKISARIETVHSVRMWEAGQRIVDREWRAIEALVGARVVSVPNDPSKPLCLGQVS